MRHDKLLIRFWIDSFIEARWDTFPDLDRRYNNSQFIKDFQYYLREYFNMPRKAKGKQNATNTNGSIGWVNVPLSDEDIDIIESDEKAPDKVLLGLLGIAEDGFSFSLKYNDDRDQFSASMYGKPTDSDNGLVGLSAFATDPTTALFVLCFKYHVILGRRLEAPTGTATNRRNFG